MEDASVPFESFQSYRPTTRPPMARLTIYDDGCSDGEVIRLREDRTTIGSERAVVRIPHDSLISPCHIAIDRIFSEGEYRWVLTDLNSLTGLWIRVRKTRLKNESEFTVGKNFFRFQDGDSSRDDRRQIASRIADGSIPGIDLSEDVSSPSRSVACLEKSIRQQDQSFEFVTYLLDGEYWIGKSIDCEIPFPNDPFLIPKHVRIFKEESFWYAETQGAPNGLWIRVDRLVVQDSCAFQIGEQRFHLSCKWNDD